MRKPFLLILGLGLVLCTSCNNNKSENNEHGKGGDTTAAADTSASSAATDTAKNPVAQGTPTDTTSAGYVTTLSNTLLRLEKTALTGNADHDFATLMLQHHEGGISIADREATHGKDEKLVSLAKSIKEKLEKETKQLQQYTQTKPAATENKKFIEEVQKAINQAKSSVDSIRISNDVDKDFVTVLSQHYKSGISLAKAEVAHGKNQKLKTMAQQMIKEQQQTITDLQSGGGQASAQVTNKQ